MLAVKDLSTLHDKHLNRPTLDDNVDEEHAIEITTQEITQVGLFRVIFYANEKNSACCVPVLHQTLFTLLQD